MNINDFANLLHDRALAHDVNEKFDWKFYIIAMSGEAGETANLLKKYIRGDYCKQLVDTDFYLSKKIAEEAADVISYGLLLIKAIGYDPEKVLIDKFGKVNARLADGGFGARPTGDERE